MCKIHNMIQPGSLVVYIGGQYKADIDAGLGLSRDVIYEVKKKGWALLNRKQVKCIWLQERPNEHHAIGMFREVQGPGTINFEELLSQPRPKKIEEPAPAYSPAKEPKPAKAKV